MVAILEKRKLRDFDWLLTLLALAISLFGTWMIYNAVPDAPYWKKQLIGIGVSTVVMLAVAFTDYRKIKSFRNVIVHGYDAIDPETTWGVVEHKLPVLRAELAKLMQQTP